MNFSFLFLAEAGNRTVAGRVSGSGFKVGKMEPLTPAPGELLEGLFQDDMPMELTEADYLDSFLDLSNFLPGVRVDYIFSDLNEQLPALAYITSQFSFSYF